MSPTTFKPQTNRLQPKIFDICMKLNQFFTFVLKGPEVNPKKNKYDLTGESFNSSKYEYIL